MCQEDVVSRLKLGRQGFTLSPTRETMGCSPATTPGAKAIKARNWMHDGCSGAHENSFLRNFNGAKGVELIIFLSIIEKKRSG